MSSRHVLFLFKYIFFFFLKKKKRNWRAIRSGKKIVAGIFYTACVCVTREETVADRKRVTRHALFFFFIHSFLVFLFFVFLFYCVGHVPLYYFTRWVVSYGQISRRPPTETLRCARPTRRPLVQTQIHAGDVYCGSEFVSAHRENVRFIFLFFHFFFFHLGSIWDINGDHPKSATTLN